MMVPLVLQGLLQTLGSGLRLAYFASLEPIHVHTELWDNAVSHPA